MRPHRKKREKLSCRNYWAQEEDPESEKIQSAHRNWGQKNLLGRYSGDWMEDSGGALLLVAVQSFSLQDKDLHDLVEKKKRENVEAIRKSCKSWYTVSGSGIWRSNLRFCRVAEDYEKERKRGVSPLGSCIMARRHNPGDTYGSAGRGKIWELCSAGQATFIRQCEALM